MDLLFHWLEAVSIELESHLDYVAPGEPASARVVAHLHSLQSLEGRAVVYAANHICGLDWPLKEVGQHLADVATLQ
jgi:hypothetical protein